MINQGEISISHTPLLSCHNPSSKMLGVLALLEVGEAGKAGDHSAPHSWLTWLSPLQFAASSWGLETPALPLIREGVSAAAAQPFYLINACGCRM